jgi:hypothetical protein
MLKICEDADLVLDGASLVTRAFPAPDLSVPSQPAQWSAQPGNARRDARPQNGEAHQCEAPIQLRSTLKMPKQNAQKTEKPQAQQQCAQKTRTPQRINNRRGVVQGQGSLELERLWEQEIRRA